MVEVTCWHFPSFGPTGFFVENRHKASGSSKLKRYNVTWSRFAFVADLRTSEHLWITRTVDVAVIFNDSRTYIGSHCLPSGQAQSFFSPQRPRKLSLGPAQTPAPRARGELGGGPASATLKLGGLPGEGPGAAGSASSGEGRELGCESFS